MPRITARREKLYLDYVQAKIAEQEAIFVPSNKLFPQTAAKRQMLDTKIAHKGEDTQFQTIGNFVKKSNKRESLDFLSVTFVFSSATSC